MTTGTGLLQALRFKGRAEPALLAAAVDDDVADVKSALADLVATGAARENKGRYQLTPEGRELLLSRLDEEGAAVDQIALRAAYEEFDGHNAAFKQLVTDWQLIDGAPNDHTDAAYDAAVGRGWARCTPASCLCWRGSSLSRPGSRRTPFGSPPRGRRCRPVTTPGSPGR